MKLQLSILFCLVAVSVFSQPIVRNQLDTNSPPRVTQDLFNTSLYTNSGASVYYWWTNRVSGTWLGIVPGLGLVKSNAIAGVASLLAGTNGGLNIGGMTSVGAGNAAFTNKVAIGTNGVGSAALSVQGNGTGLAFVVNTNQLVVTNGNVGVGITPVFKMQVLNLATGVTINNYGMTVENDSTLTADIPETAGLSATVRQRGSVTQTGVGKGASALLSSAFNYDTATAADLNGMRVDVRNLNSGTVTDAKGIWINTMQNTGGGTIQNTYGLKIDTSTSGTKNYSIYTGTAPSIFGGNIVVSNTAAAAQQSVVATTGGQLFITAPTNAVAPPAQVMQPIGYFASMMLTNTNTVTIGAGSTYYVLTNFTTLRTNGFVTIGTNGFITNVTAGFYRITCNVSMVGGGSDTLEGALFLDETRKPEITVFGTYDNPARIRTMSASGILYMPAATGLSFRLNNNSGANNITVWRAGVTIGTP